MSEDARTVIAEVLADHPEMVTAYGGDIDRNNECLCCVHTDSWEDHLAAEIVAGLKANRFIVRKETIEEFRGYRMVGNRMELL